MRVETHGDHEEEVYFKTLFKWQTHLLPLKMIRGLEEQHQGFNGYKAQEGQTVNFLLQFGKGISIPPLASARTDEPLRVTEDKFHARTGFYFMSGKQDGASKRIS